MAKSLFGCALLMVLPVVASGLTMEMVTVGDPGNAPDPMNTNSVPDLPPDMGTVPYVYEIGKFEVRNDQYAEFLNSVAAADTYALYHAGMSEHACGGINRSGLYGSYTYATKPGYEDLPVVYVSFYDAVRFINWLENGQPTGAQGPCTTETGSYTLLTDGENTTNVTARAANATWVIPNDNEWYKAAYYDPTASGTTNYWLYPTRSDSTPNSRPPNMTDANSANFRRYEDPVDGVNDGYAKTLSNAYHADTNYLTPVGSYGVADSYYGTFDQAGNAFEWDEAIVEGSKRILRGGPWNGEWISLRSQAVSAYMPSIEIGSLGFRVAAIPKAPVLCAASPMNGEVCLTLRGSVGLPHQVEVSSSLTNWQPWAIVTLPAGGWSTNFPTDPEIPRRFWRARQGDAPPGFVLVPPGNFEMGNSFDASEGHSDELPRHTVYVSAFYMQTTEITKAQWDEVRAWGSTNGYSDLSSGAGKGSDHPVQMVNWYDVVKWCNARSEKESLTPCYYTDSAQMNVYRVGQLNIGNDSVDWSSRGYRLPTEAEWEKAARGGASGHRFPWSDADTITHSRANYNSYWVGGVPYYSYDANAYPGYRSPFSDGGTPYTNPVGYFAANGYGLYDMAANVREWCWDWHGSYSTSPSSDPAGPTSGLLRVLRGGDWYGQASRCRVANRGYDPPVGSFDNRGFRPVRR